MMGNTCLHNTALLSSITNHKIIIIPFCKIYTSIISVTYLVFLTNRKYIINVPTKLALKLNKPSVMKARKKNLI